MLLRVAITSAATGGALHTLATPPAAANRPHCGRQITRLAVMLAAGTLITSLPSTAHADDYGYHCPPTAGQTMSIAPGAAGKCVHGVRHKLTFVAGWRKNNQSAVHCVGADETRTNDVHVINYSCGVGSSPDGYRSTDYLANGRWGYPIHKNNATVTLSGFSSLFSFIPGTLAARADAAGQFRPRRAHSAVAGELLRKFRIFRRARRPSDRLGIALQGPAVSTFYADQTRWAPPQGTTRAASSNRDDASVWVAAGPGNKICLLTMSEGSDGQLRNVCPPPMSRLANR